MLLVVGDGYNIKQYKKMVKEKKLEDKVLFFGRSNNIDQLVDLYNLSICTVVPSEFESFSLVALESMSCSTPVIMSDVAGARKRIVDRVDGYLFKSDDKNDLAEKMNKIIDLNKETLLSMGTLGRKKIEKKYDWDTHIEKLKKLYIS